MTVTPHEAVAKALAGAYGSTLHFRFHAYQRDATAAIEALREGAVERIHDALYVTGGSYTMETLIDAILGPPNEVPE